MPEEVEPSTVGAALPAEIMRIIREVLPRYYDCGTAGVPAIMIMHKELAIALKAMAEQDTIQMIRSLLSLRDMRS